MSFFRKNQEFEEDLGRSQRSSTLAGSVIGSFISQSGESRRFVPKENINIVHIKLISKDEYKKQQHCMICQSPFTMKLRQHHCRVCANAVCGQCSNGTINKQRACDVCYLRWSDPNRQQRKQKLISCLQTLLRNMQNLKQQKSSILRQLKKQKIDPSQILKVDNDQLARYEEQSSQIKKRKTEAQAKATQSRKKKQQLQRKINEYKQQIES